MNANTLAHSSYMSADLGGNSLNISLDNVIKPGLRALISPKHSIQHDYPSYTLDSIDHGRTSRTAAVQKRGSPHRTNDMSVYEMISNGMKNQFNLTKPKFNGVKGYMIPDANEINFKTRNIASNRLDKKDHFTE